MKENTKEYVKRFLMQYIKSRPIRISLKLEWDNKKSRINLIGNGLNQTIVYPDTISFTSFAYGVIEAYEEVYGKLKVVPISFREEIYKNDKVSLNLYPAGSVGIFDIYIKYREEIE
jgi:hypothetical protein